MGRDSTKNHGSRQKKLPAAALLRTASFVGRDRSVEYNCSAFQDHYSSIGGLFVLVGT